MGGTAEHDAAQEEIVFLVPADCRVVIDLKSRRLAYATWRSIVVSGAFLMLDEDVQSAIILHELAHLKKKHALKRVFWILTGKWFSIPKLLAAAREQEFEADDYVGTMGYAKALMRFLVTHKSPDGGFHPKPSERIARLLVRHV
jgi:beta-lactamase regulating signal transducer with metallopeptidase domain